MTQLPDKLSELIVVALEDLAKVERDPDFMVHMSMFFTPNWNESGKCAVCFAGAVMAMSLDANPNRFHYTLDWGADIQRKMHALDHVRNGLLGAALLSMGQDRKDTPRHVGITTYEQSSCAWRRDMINIAHDLAARGL